MERYDYLEAITEDVKQYIKDHFSLDEISENSENRQEWESQLYDELWNEDSVTGNASGSYTCNAYQAHEYIAHNWDLLAEAMTEFGCEANVLVEGAERCDVTIRCYLLWQAISAALDELEDEKEEEQ